MIVNGRICGDIVVSRAFGTCNSKQRMRCCKKEFKKKDGQKNLFLVYNLTITVLLHADM